MRSRRLFPLPHLLLLALVMAAAPCAHAQVPDANDGPLQTNTDIPHVRLIGNADIVKMAKAGLSDDVLFNAIQTKPGHYDTAPEDLIDLKSAGVSDRIIAAMQAHGTGLAVRDAATRSTRYGDPARIDPVPIARGVDEIGIYYKATKGEHAGEWLPLETERVVFRSAGTVKSILSQGVLAKDLNGTVDGEKSPLALHTGVELLIYAPAGTDGNEYDFLRLREHKDRREFRALTGGVFHSTTGPGPDELEFHPKKIAPEMYTFTVPIDIEKGEYGVLPPGAANVKGIADTGKIFTFSIPE